MTTEDELKAAARRKRLLAAIENALSKTVENGCTEEEAAAAQATAMRLMEENSIEEWELLQKSGETQKRLMVREELNIKYANGWRVSLASAVAHNTGVYFTYIGRANVLTYWGQEHAVKAAKLIIEYLIHTVEDLGKAHARNTGTGTKGRRDFCEGAGGRLWFKVHQSANLTHDVRLPAILKGQVEEANEYAKSVVGKIRNGNDQMGSKRSDYTESYHHGREAAERIDVRGGTRTKEIR